MNKMTKALLGSTALVVALGSATASAQVELTIESWRNDDLAIWQDTIIPAFEAQHPDIKVTFAPTAPTEYDAALRAKLEGGTAGDLITCRPFDTALQLYESDYLANLNDLPGLDAFGDVAKSAWLTDDGADLFCVPMASVIHGFMYNADAFAEVGVEVPTTEEEFFAVLEAFKADGTYAPLGMGTADQWESATMGYQNIGPNYWKGEAGRLAIIDGSAKLTDAEWVAPFETLAKWADYLPAGYEAQSYPDSQNMFTLGRAAIYPTGSWEINGFTADSDFQLGAFKAPVAADGDTCYISDHVDIALGMNAASPNAEAARTFLEWATTAEFAGLYANSLPGFFSLSNHDVTMENPLAQEFVSWRADCESTIRSAHQILNRGTPSLWLEMWGVSANVINGTQTPAEAAAQLQDGLATWYEPQQ